MTDVKTIRIDDVEYVRADSIKDVATPKGDMPYVIIRADRAGVFAGYLEKRTGSEVIMQECRRIFYWDGAASISQMAIDGVSKPQNCKFPEAVNRAEILGVIEVIPCTEKARKSIANVGVWKS